MAVFKIITHEASLLQEVCFMLPSLLALLLDCAKKPDQTVVSISLGALVHLIEVGGHQFSDTDWETLLKSIRFILFCFLKIFGDEYLINWVCII